MDNQNEERWNALIKWLCNYCFTHKIGFLLTCELPSEAPSKSYKIPADLIVVNMNRKPQTEIPFMFAHEIGHIIKGSPCFYHSSSTNTIKGEADQFAIKLLNQYCEENDIHFDNYYRFAETFGMPKRIYYHMPVNDNNWVTQ